jgi:lipopolysaccharide/colanic/teichoic acid biosynthesis glycosyltransferase
MQEVSASHRLTMSEEGLRRLGAFSQADSWQFANSWQQAQLAAKRSLDIVGASLLLLVLLPVFAIVAVLVACSSPGPILFKQERLGRNGDKFWFYKFRTMLDGNDPTGHRTYAQALIRGEAQAVRGSFKLADDPRVTRVGAFLRRYSIDEFPQLLNVLHGQMSLVGPRPPLPYEAELYSPLERQRFSVAPGITGLWQVSGRSRLTFDEMIDLDLMYIDRWSFWLDVQIVLRTPLAVLAGDGAR